MSEIAAGGYGVTILVLVILAVVVYAIGWALQRWGRS